ncbi:MAG: WYL domain-containing protein [Bacteroidales bacterium]
MPKNKNAYLSFLKYERGAPIEYDRLTNQFDLMDQYPNDKIDKYILFEYTKGFAGKHMLSGIYEAISDKKEITFTHCRFESDLPTQRILQPYILKEHRNRWYVIGKENCSPKIFGLDRISNLDVTDNDFIQDPGFYDEIFRVLYGSAGVFAFGVKSEDVVLHFGEDEAPYIKSLPLRRSQQIIDDSKTEGMTVRLHVKVTPAFICENLLLHAFTPIPKAFEAPMGA